MTDASLKKEILATIAEQLALDVADVSAEKSFIQDLNADSLDLTELIMTLEERFSIEIADDEAEKLKTVQDVLSFIEQKKKPA
jgi:acyl carrier protein